MYVIKRNGHRVAFDINKIIDAINKAFMEVDKKPNIEIATSIGHEIETLAHDDITVEEIQDYVEDALMRSERRDVARAFIRYRYKREICRQTSKSYDSILKLLEFENQELKEENSNKNAIIASTQRDYMAGEISKELTQKYLLPSAVVEAHNNGEIHFHDADYFAQHIMNCCLVNLEDMLQNGTVINKTLIEKPHSFATACNIATQIVAVVASGQYGGQSISAAHLAPFVDVSRQKIRKEIIEELNDLHQPIEEATVDMLTEKRLKEEIKRGVQTIQYQINTLNTSNGQTPFITVFMYINEAKNEREKQDLALIIEEILRQRIEGVKNEVGQWITPTFPKLIYALDENNITPDSPYWYLTKLAAECTAKRMVPDYISVKKMKELKLSTGEKPGEGDVYTCMGKRKLQLM